MSQKTYVSTCVTIVVVGVALTVAQMLVDGVSAGDFIALLGIPLGLIAVTVARRNADRGSSRSD